MAYLRQSPLKRQRNFRPIHNLDGPVIERVAAKWALKQKMLQHYRSIYAAEIDPTHSVKHRSENNI
jgi:hypothetical protein